MHRSKNFVSTRFILTILLCYFQRFSQRKFLIAHIFMCVGGKFRIMRNTNRKRNMIEMKRKTERKRLKSLFFDEFSINKYMSLVWFFSPVDIFEAAKMNS